MQLDDELKQLLRDYLTHLHEVDATRGPTQTLLRQTLDLAAFPTDLTKLLSLSPPLYDGETRQFQWQRTPNRFVTVGGNINDGNEHYISDSIYGVATDNFPKNVPDGKSWRVLGGVYTCDGATRVQFKDAKGGNCFYFVELTAGAAGLPQQFTLPGNGKLIKDKSIVVLFGSANNARLTFFVSEEPADTTGRGGV